MACYGLGNVLVIKEEELKRDTVKMNNRNLDDKLEKLNQNVLLVKNSLFSKPQNHQQQQQQLQQQRYPQQQQQHQNNGHQNTKSSENTGSNGPRTFVQIRSSEYDETNDNETILVKANNETVVVKPSSSSGNLSADLSDFEDYEDYETEDGQVIVPIRIEALNDDADDTEEGSKRKRKKAPRKIEKEGGAGYEDMMGAGSSVTGDGGDKPYKCDLCHWQFKQRYRFKRHMRTHTGERPYACPHPDCGKSFSRSHILKVHMMIHSGDKPFRCEECGWSFMKKYHLQRHQRTHTGEMPFVCNECSVHFSRPYYLKKHLVQAHGAIIDDINGPSPAKGKSPKVGMGAKDGAVLYMEGEVVQMEMGEKGGDVFDGGMEKGEVVVKQHPPPLIPMQSGGEKTASGSAASMVTSGSSSQGSTTSPYFRKIKSDVPSPPPGRVQGFPSNQSNNDNNNNNVVYSNENTNNNNNDNKSGVDCQLSSSNSPIMFNQNNTMLTSANSPIPPGSPANSNSNTNYNNSCAVSNNRDGRGSDSLTTMSGLDNKPTTFPTSHFNMASMHTNDEPSHQISISPINSTSSSSGYSTNFSQGPQQNTASNVQGSQQRYSVQGGSREMSGSGNQYFVTPGNRNINTSFSNNQYNLTNKLTSPISSSQTTFSSTQGLGQTISSNESSESLKECIEMVNHFVDTKSMESLQGDTGGLVHHDAQGHGERGEYTMRV